jgi:hypothetical protein
MAGPVLYSTNPWIAHDIAVKYLEGKHFCWCSEYFDPTAAPAASAAALIAPSSSPKTIFYNLLGDCEREDKHSTLIKGYRKTFRRLANNWFADDVISASQRDEIIATMAPGSYRIWRPVIYVIPREPIEGAGRLVAVPAALRASYGGEYQVKDLSEAEFDLIEVGK